MSVGSQTAGRRERNKQEKLDRIMAAAGELFAERGVDEVTTQQIADRADIGTGTLFLYAKSKGELLLLVQNAHYAAALERGRAGADAAPDELDAVMAIVGEIVACNRVQVDNGRSYLREMAFGDAAEPRHAEALAIAEQTGEAIAAVLARDGRRKSADAATMARVVSAIMFVSMAAGANATASIAKVLEQIRTQAAVLLRR